MEKTQVQGARKAATETERDQTEHYLNHGVESLVAMDNPDDSQLGADGGPSERKPS